MKKIKILGTTYKIIYKTKEQDKRLESVDAYCDYSIKQIICIRRTEKDKSEMDLLELSIIDKRILRHEILHAFIYESGLWCNSFNVQQWAMSEEMTDWFAIQSPKIYEIYKKLNILN